MRSTLSNKYVIVAQKFQSLPMIFGYRILDILINSKNKPLDLLTLSFAVQSMSKATVGKIYIPVCLTA